MKFEEVVIEKKVIVGKSIKTTNENGKSIQDIGMMWGSFMGDQQYTLIANVKDQKAVGLYTGYEGGATAPYTFMCGVEVETLAEQEGFDLKIIPSGKYAKFTIHGDLVQAVGKAWGEIWEMDLKRKFSSDFEVYHNDSEDMSNQTIDIYISLNE